MSQGLVTQRSSSDYGVLTPRGSLLKDLNGAPLLFPTAASASRSGKTTRGNVVVPVTLEWKA